MLTLAVLPKQFKESEDVEDLIQKAELVRNLSQAGVKKYES